MAMPYYRLHLLALSTFWCAMSLCDSANHYCVNGSPMRLELDDFYHKDETIVPEIPDEPVNKALNHKDCKWEISVNTASEHLRLVLEAIQSEVRSSGAAGRKNISHLTMASPELTSKVSAGQLQALSIHRRWHLTVEINWDPKTQIPSPVNLRIMIPIAGLCSRDMLSFHGNCYAISSLRTDISEAIGNCQGDAQLASFINMSQVNEFIEANNAQLNEYPYRRPLNLSQAVRIGMFYNATDARIMSVVRSDGGCQLRPVERSEEMKNRGLVTGACATLRVDESGRAVIEFGDCGNSMLALMSFPETAGDDGSAANECGRDLVGQVKALEMRNANLSEGARKMYFSGPTRESQVGDRLIQIWTVVPASVSAVIAVYIVVVVFVFHRRKLSHHRCHESQSRNSKSAPIISDPSSSHHQKPAMETNPRDERPGHSDEEVVQMIFAESETGTRNSTEKSSVPVEEHA